jgi:small subunit ribosomal protein S20
MALGGGVYCQAGKIGDPDLQNYNAPRIHEPDVCYKGQRRKKRLTIPVLRAYLCKLLTNARYLYAMPQHKSAEKRVRQSAKRRLRNRYFKVMMRNALKAVKGADSKEALIEESRKATKVLDRLATKGLIHKNFAAHRKSQMARLIAEFDQK